MYISNELEKISSDLDKEKELLMKNIMVQMNPKIINFNTNLGKYFLINHLVEKLSEQTENENAELIKSMEYKESKCESWIDRNEYEMTESSYEHSSILFENPEGIKLKFYKLVKGYDTTAIEIKLDGKAIWFDWKFMDEHIEKFILHCKKII